MWAAPAPSSFSSAASATATGASAANAAGDAAASGHGNAKSAGTATAAAAAAHPSLPDASASFAIPGNASGMPLLSRAILLPPATHLTVAVKSPTSSSSSSSSAMASVMDTAQMASSNAFTVWSEPIDLLTPARASLRCGALDASREIEYQLGAAVSNAPPPFDPAAVLTLTPRFLVRNLFEERPAVVRMGGDAASEGRGGEGDAAATGGGTAARLQQRHVLPPSQAVPTPIRFRRGAPRRLQLPRPPSGAISPQPRPSRPRRPAHAEAAATPPRPGRRRSFFGGGGGGGGGGTPRADVPHAPPLLLGAGVVGGDRGGRDRRLITARARRHATANAQPPPLLIISNPR